MTQSEFNQMLKEAISQGVFDADSFKSQFSGEQLEAYLTKMVSFQESDVPAYVESAKAAADRAEAALTNAPKIQNGTWWVYNKYSEAYEDSGVAATGPMGTITKIERTAGTGASGSLDTYTVTCSDGAKFTFTVQNGKDGSGTGNMDASVYDPNGKGQDIFAYCDAAIGNSIAASY